MTAPTALTNLIDTFHRNRDAYRSPAYNETQLRHEFLDPFFIALGWDVNNTAGYAEAYKDVIHEDSLKIGAAQTPNEKTALQRQIQTTDQQIDKLVYELYNLTDDEINIVANSASK